MVRLSASLFSALFHTSEPRRLVVTVDSRSCVLVAEAGNSRARLQVARDAIDVYGLEELVERIVRRPRQPQKPREPIGACVGVALLERDQTPSDHHSGFVQ